MNVETINIAAVVFVNMTSNSNYKLAKPKSQPYFYLNIIDAVKDDLCLVHTGDCFALVQIARIIDKSESLALSKVGKPLLAKINYDEELLGTASAKLKEFLEATEDDRLQLEIDKALGRVSPEEFMRIEASRTGSFGFPMLGSAINYQDAIDALRRAYPNASTSTIDRYLRQGKHFELLRKKSREGAKAADAAICEEEEESEADRIVNRMAFGRD